MRNTHLLAIAPTVSNSVLIIAQQVLNHNQQTLYVFNGAKGTFIVKNPELKNY
jgi:hypothetical protein